MSGLLIAIAIAAIGLVIAVLRRGTVAAIGRPTARMLEFTSPHNAEETKRRVLEGVRDSAYKVDDQDELIVILSSRPTASSWGFFYPVIITAQPDGSAKVQIGIKSKLIQMGPVVTNAHRKCLEAVQPAVLA